MRRAGAVAAPLVAWTFRLLDAVGVVDDAIEDGIRDCALTDHVVPKVYRQLAPDEDELSLVASFGEFEDVPSFLEGEAFQAPVVEADQVEPLQPTQQAGMSRRAAHLGEVDQEVGNAAVEHGEPLHACLVGKGADEKGFADPGCPADAKMMRVADPLSRCQLRQQGSGDAPSFPAAHVLNVRLDTQSRAAQVGEIAAVVAVGEFPLQQHGKPVVEAEFPDVRDHLLFFRGFCHAVQAELQHALDIRLPQGHGRVPPPSRLTLRNAAAPRTWR